MTPAYVFVNNGGNAKATSASISGQNVVSTSSREARNQNRITSPKLGMARPMFTALVARNCARR